jgi:hypothetical protein
MEERLEASEQRYQQADFDAELRRTQDRETACWAVANSGRARGRSFSWSDCAYPPHRPSVTKEQFEKATGTCSRESEMPAFKAHVQTCVEEQGRLVRDQLDRGD